MDPEQRPSTRAGNGPKRSRRNDCESVNALASPPLVTGGIPFRTEGPQGSRAASMAGIAYQKQTCGFVLTVCNNDGDSCRQRAQKPRCPRLGQGSLGPRSSAPAIQGARRQGPAPAARGPRGPGFQLGLGSRFGLTTDRRSSVQRMLRNSGPQGFQSGWPGQRGVKPPGHHQMR